MGACRSMTEVWVVQHAEDDGWYDIASFDSYHDALAAVGPECDFDGEWRLISKDEKLVGD